MLDPSQPSTPHEARGSDADEIELLERLVDRIFNAGMLLRLAMDEVSAVGAARIEGAIAELDDALRDIRRDVFSAVERGEIDLT